MMPRRQSPAERLQLDADALGQRLQFLGIDDGDLRNAERIHAVIDGDADAIAAEFLDHLQQFEPLQPLLGRSGEQRRLRRLLRAWLRTLGREPGSLQYAEQRLRLGARHERLGLSLHWFLDALPQLFAAIVRRLQRAEPGRVGELAVSLHRLLMFDAGLATEIYHKDSVDRVEVLVHRLERSQQRLREESRHDALTGVLTRGAALEVLGRELQRALRFGQPFALLMFDVDHFKALNDQHGHAFGDLVLHRTAALCQQVVRPFDVLGRLGGDEFVVGLLACPLGEATRIAERIRRCIAGSGFARGDDTAAVTLSVGVAAARPGVGLESLLEQVDRALYRAKQRRNRVCASGEAGRSAAGHG